MAPSIAKETNRRLQITPALNRLGVVLFIERCSLIAGIMLRFQGLGWGLRRYGFRQTPN